MISITSIYLCLAKKNPVFKNLGFDWMSYFFIFFPYEKVKIE